jgi:hypothetical protein
MLRLFDSILDRSFAVIGAIVFSQAPEFFQQYTQRLAGHVSELQHHIQLLKNLAKQSGKTIEAYITKFTSNPDPDFAGQGELMKHTLQRWESLHQSLDAMQNGTFYSRPFDFLYYVQSDIVTGTMHNFKPGLSLTTEGALYALLGLLFGYGVYSLIRSIFRKIFGKPKHLKPSHIVTSEE